MKKFYSLLILALLTVATAFAQEKGTRVLITTPAGFQKSFLAERVADISFPVLDARVAADVTVTEFSEDGNPVLTITRTEDCEYYRFGVQPQTMDARFSNDEVVISNLEAVGNNQYWSDFESAELTGEEFLPGVSYTIYTVGYDRWGTACDVVRTPFTMPAPALIGNPQVAYEILEVTQKTFKIKFTPNADVAGFAAVSGPAGTLQQQFEMFGPWMGFAQYGDMVKAWGIQGTTEEMTYEWTGMDAGTEYEVAVQAWDANGTYAECQTINVTTLSYGGTGEAKVDIEINEYCLQDWYGETLPSQFITFTPNDQVNCFRFGVYKTEYYDQDPEGYLSDVMMDPPMPMAYWWFYETTKTDFQIDPGTECVAIAAGKNAVGEWGAPTIVRFTTPADMPVESKRNTITPRLKAGISNGKAPLNLVPTTTPKEKGATLKMK